MNLEFLEESNEFKVNQLNSNLLEDVHLDLVYKLAEFIYNELISKVTFFNGKDILFIAMLTPYL